MIDPALHDQLEQVAQAPVLLVACDYDGTLSPLVADPAAAVPDSAAVAALVAIGGLARTHAVVISGRSRDVLRRLLGPAPNLTLIGTHGAELPDAEIDGELVTRVDAIAGELHQLAAQYPGCEVEEKPSGAAFHYRNARTGQAVAAQRARRIGDLAGARAINGKMVVELIFGDANKGMAIDSMRSRLGANAVVFVGDDTTDEDVFEVMRQSDVAVKVGPEPTLATYRVASQADVAEVLTTLASVRIANESADST